MKPRICFIGDSQVAALKLALDDPRWDGLRDRVSIFGARGTGLMSAMVCDGRITSDDELVQRQFKFTGGADGIALDGYDIFCVVGCRLNFNSVSKIAEQYSTLALGLPGRQLVSDALFEAMLLANFRRALAASVIGLIGGATGRPVYLIPDPLWSPLVRGQPKGQILNEVIALGRATAFVDLVQQCLISAFAGSANVVLQPADTRYEACFTAAEFSVGSVALGRKAKNHDETDFAHMNAAYGHRVLETFFAKVDAATAA